MQSIHFTFSFFSSFHFNTQWGDKSEGRGRVYQKVREARVKRRKKNTFIPSLVYVHINSSIYGFHNKSRLHYCLLCYGNFYIRPILY